MTREHRRPLFVPLMRAPFDAFETGTKQHEWRRYGRGWNESTCAIGREVTLSLGYSGRRLRGVITSFRTETVAPSASVTSIYPAGTVCAVIGIRITGAIDKAGQKQ